MTNLFTRLADAARRRATYRRTVAELRALPPEIARDLDINRDDAERLAARAVYGA